MIAAAETIAVTYPHMNGLGGDCYILIAGPGTIPVAIEGAGRAARQASIGWYEDRGHETIPTCGAEAALTVAIAVSGWQAAYVLSRRHYDGRTPLSRLLETVSSYARDGVAVTRSLHESMSSRLGDLRDVPGFAETYLDHGEPQTVGARLRQPRLAETLDHLARAGLDDFYRGDIARSVAADLEAVGSPLRLEDLEGHAATMVRLLSVQVAGHTVYNLPPPTQGLASLMILALYDRLGVTEADGFDFVHGLVEATKAAFQSRDRFITDPAYMTETVDRFLSDPVLDDLAAAISTDRARPWPQASGPSDTIWMGAADGDDRCVSFIQSLYWEFGSGLILPGSGITWQNRGRASVSIRPITIALIRDDVRSTRSSRQ